MQAGQTTWSLVLAPPSFSGSPVVKLFALLTRAQASFVVKPAGSEKSDIVKCMCSQMCGLQISRRTVSFLPLLGTQVFLTNAA